jgi:hypothetical protein
VCCNILHKNKFWFNATFTRKQFYVQCNISHKINFWCDTPRRRKTSSHVMCCTESDFLSDKSQNWKVCVHAMYLKKENFMSHEKKQYFHVICHIIPKVLFVRYVASHLKTNHALCLTSLNFLSLPQHLSFHTTPKFIFL